MEKQQSKGVFITFDGIDGSGKTFLINKFSQQLQEEGFKVKKVVAIGEGERGKLLRKVLLNKDEFGNINPNSETMLALCMILDSYHTAVLPAIENGEVVIMDRYLYSTVNYQFLTFKNYLDSVKGKEYKNNTTREVIYINRMLNEIMKVIPRPDVSVICTVSKETAIANMMSGRQTDFNEFDEQTKNNFDFFLKGYSKETLTDVFKDDNFVFLNNDRPYPNEATDENMNRLVQVVKQIHFLYQPNLSQS